MNTHLRDVAPHLRTEDEKAELRPRLEALSDRLCQTQPFVLQALADAGLTVVLLDNDCRQISPEADPQEDRR